MKKTIRCLAGALAAVMLFPCTALAAGPADTAQPQISVQLDGRELTFSDALPVVRDWRTFLPFRAVFEAMGAEVFYEGNTITAVRGDRTITMTIGETEATVTTAGTTLPLAMDVAPFVDPETWRTYVPVRFAAQALDCAVGWDQEAYTAVIVDTDKLVDRALAGKSFAYLAGLMGYSRKYCEGIWDSEMTMHGKVSVADPAAGEPVYLPFEASGAGTVADGTRVQVSTNVKMDLSAFARMIEDEAEEAGVSVGGRDPQVQAFVQDLAAEGIGIDLRGDLEAGTLCMNPRGNALDALLNQLVGGFGMEKLWLSIDLPTLYGEMGVNFDEVMEASKTVDYIPVLKGLIRSASVNSASDSYTQLCTAVEQMAADLADDAFVWRGDTCTAKLSMAEGEITLTMREGAVVGYSVDVDRTAAVTELGEDGFSPVGQLGSVRVTCHVTMDESDRLSGSITVALGEVMTVAMDISGSYTPGLTAPVTNPPVGSIVVDLTSELGRMPI